jgi:hypothetical protein
VRSDSISVAETTQFEKIMTKHQEIYQGKPSHYVQLTNSGKVFWTREQICSMIQGLKGLSQMILLMQYHD